MHNITILVISNYFNVDKYATNDGTRLGEYQGIILLRWTVNYFNDDIMQQTNFKHFMQTNIELIVMWIVICKK